MYVHSNHNIYAHVRFAVAKVLDGDLVEKVCPPRPPGAPAAADAPTKALTGQRFIGDDGSCMKHWLQYLHEGPFCRTRLSTSANLHIQSSYVMG